MRLETAALVASVGLFFACASPDDDSWEGAADDELGEGAGGSGGAPSTTKGATKSSTNTVTTGNGPTTAPSTTGANTNTVASTTSPAVTTGGGCDVGTCEDCQSCALNGGPCTAAVDACFNDTECYALIDCLSNCFDDVCFNQCATDHQAGMPLYNAVGECVFCDVCVTTCGAC
ncbi:MAG: hypothetical protein HOV80_19035 [Polyangiaceae bacterium]|nr:hypothetical protein [Polyangiaceae bacterium]